MLVNARVISTGRQPKKNGDSTETSCDSGAQKFFLGQLRCTGIVPWLASCRDWLRAMIGFVLCLVACRDWQFAMIGYDSSSDSGQDWHVQENSFVKDLYF